MEDLNNNEIREIISTEFNIKHMSLSSMSNFIKDQGDFHKKYILGQREDFEQNPALIIGKAVHTAIEFYRRQKLEGQTIELQTMKLAGEAEIERIAQTSKVNYGANSSYDICLATVKDSIVSYYNDAPNYIPLYVEKDYTLSNEELILPLKGVLDLIAEDEKGIYVVDHKTVSSFTEKGKVKASYELQAGDYYYLCKEISGKYPHKVIFDEIMKGQPDPFNGLKQIDLRKLCDENNINRETGNNGRYFTNDGMKIELMKTGKFEAKIRNQYVVDFETSVAHLAFKEIFNMVCIDLYVKCKLNIKFIPNPYEYWNGDKSYIDRISDIEKENLAF